MDDGVVLLHLLLCRLKPPFGLAPGLHIGLALRLQGHDLLFELGLLKKVVITRQHSHILGEVHAILFIHRTLVDDTRAKAVGLQLGDEELLVLQEVELVAVKCPLYGIDDDVDVIASKLLGNLIAGAPGTTVALLQIRRPPGYVDVMDGHSTFLGVYTCSQCRGRTEQHSDAALVHGFDQFLALLLILGLLNKADFALRDAIVIDKLILDLCKNVPLTRLVGREVTEDELCSLLLVVLLIVLRYKSCTVAGLVVRIVIEQAGGYQSHVE